MGMTVSLTWASLGLSALDTFLWGPWLLVSCGQSVQIENSPYHLLINLLKHKDLYIDIRARTQGIPWHILSHPCAQMKTLPCMTTDINRLPCASAQRPPCRGRYTCFRQGSVSNCWLSNPVLPREVGSCADFLLVSF